jgi:diadenosine tetraphosphate (Ap4A) HIT family hydrolase
MSKTNEFPFGFSVPGVEQGDVWQLFNISNFPYYLKMVSDLRSGNCPFCTVDPAVNKPALDDEDPYWHAFYNTVAPRNGQLFQFVIPCKRHIEHVSELTPHEMVHLRKIIASIDAKYEITGGVLLVRTGDHRHNAKSIRHLHFNYQVPTGVDDVSVTIGKSVASLEKKLPVLYVYEKMRSFMEAHNVEADDALLALEHDERRLVQDKMGPPKLAKHPTAHATGTATR